MEIFQKTVTLYLPHRDTQGNIINWSFLISTSREALRMLTTNHQRGLLDKHPSALHVSCFTTLHVVYLLGVITTTNSSNIFQSTIKPQKCAWIMHTGIGCELHTWMYSRSPWLENRHYVNIWLSQTTTSEYTSPVKRAQVTNQCRSRWRMRAQTNKGTGASIA